MTKKTLAVLTAGIIAAQLTGAEKIYPQEFKVFLSDKITTENAASLRFEDDVLLLDEKTQIPAQKVKIDGNILDLRKLDPGKKFQFAAITAAVYADKPGKLRMGMGADWWFDCYCNGKFVFGTTQSGNLFWPPTVTSFVFELPLRAGRNELTIFTRSGIGGWTVAVGEPPADAQLNKPRQLPLPAKVLYGPYLTNPGADSITVSYVIQGRQPLELEYRKKGNKVWKKIQILRGGQLLDEGPVMRFDLKDLAPDTVYEYRALKRVGTELRQSEPDEVRTFRTFSSKNQNFSFWIMADTQTDNFSKLKHLKNLLDKRRELAKADMFLHLGDFSSNQDDIELSLFDSFLKLIPKHQLIVPMRGNHEFDGAQSGRYLKYLASKDNKSYQAFRIGNIFFIILDTGHHLPKDSKNSFQKFTGLNELDTLLAEQTAWLKEVVKSKDFAEADYRMVFAHIAPHSQRDEFNHMLPRLRKMTRDVFKGNPAPYPVDLWFAGHTHVYKVTPADKEWNFPVIIPGGGARKFVNGVAVLVKVKNNQIFIETMDSDGKTRDKFELKNKSLLKK
ncbi:MAG: metallophosphoesterase family protein [Lentisphaerae bacterium]|nr:metallophosphoesterase family protein [Lentisphaerota bacterium]